MSENRTFRMTPELVGVLTVGVALAGLVIAVWLDLRGDMRELRQGAQQLRDEISATRDHITTREDRLRREMREDHTLLRNDVRGVEEDVNSVLSRVTVTETTLGFIRDSLQEDDETGPR